MAGAASRMRPGRQGWKTWWSNREKNVERQTSRSGRPGRHDALCSLRRLKAAGVRRAAKEPRQNTPARQPFGAHRSIMQERRWASMKES
jgi:hypothetical protein